jgi:hypothetical protein
MRTDGLSGWRNPVFKLIRLAALSTILVVVVLYHDRLFDELLLWRFDSSDPDTRNAAAEKLIERRSVRAVPAFLKHSREVPRHANQDFLGRLLDTFEEPEIEALVRQARSNDPKPANQLLFALDHPGASSMARFSPIFCAALHSTNSDIRRYAAEGLSRLGPGAREATVDLRAALNDPSDMVRFWAKIALASAEIDPGEAVRQ